MEGRSPAAGGTILVLGGGGGRGAAQLGVLRALARRGIQPDACVGTSVGALNAAVVAAHPLPEAVRLLEQIWTSPQTGAVFRAERMRIVCNRLRRRPYLRSGQCIRDLVRYASALSGISTFEGLRLPLHIIITDLLAGEPVVASSGPLEDALCASCAIPGVFPPVRHGDRLYVDGGVTENCSLATAARLAPARIIAIDLTGNLAPPLRRWSEVIDRMMEVALHARVLADFDRFSARLPVTLISARSGTALRMPKFRDFTGLRDAAFAATERLLPTITTPDGLLAPGHFYLPVGLDG